MVGHYGFFKTGAAVFCTNKFKSDIRKHSQQSGYAVSRHRAFQCTAVPALPAGTAKYKQFLLSQKCVRYSWGKAAPGGFMEQDADFPEIFPRSAES